MQQIMKAACAVVFMARNLTAKAGESKGLRERGRCVEEGRLRWAALQYRSGGHLLRKFW